MIYPGQTLLHVTIIIHVKKYFSIFGDSNAVHPFETQFSFDLIKCHRQPSQFSLRWNYWLKSFVVRLQKISGWQIQIQQKVNRTDIWGIIAQCQS